MSHFYLFIQTQNKNSFKYILDILGLEITPTANNLELNLFYLLFNKYLSGFGHVILVIKLYELIHIHLQCIHAFRLKWKSLSI